MSLHEAADSKMQELSRRGMHDQCRRCMTAAGGAVARQAANGCDNPPEARHG